MGNQNHIVYGALALRPGGSGVQTYQRELLRGIARLADETYTLSATVQKDSVGELPERIAPIAVPVSGGMKRALLGLRPVKEASIFHSLDVDLPFAQRGVLVSTVHDMSVFDTPWAMSAVRARGEQALLRRSLKTADELIAVSEFTAERIHALTGRSAHVVPLAPASWARVPSDDEVEKVRSKYGLPDRFAFQLGTVEPRKRPDIAANAAELIGIPMVLAGAGSDNPDLGFPALGLGYVDREDIPALYRRRPSCATRQCTRVSVCPRSRPWPAAPSSSPAMSAASARRWARARCSSALSTSTSGRTRFAVSCSMRARKNSCARRHETAARNWGGKTSPDRP